jgi:predicted nucleotidyltransferase component of viral defense system
MQYDIHSIRQIAFLQAVKRTPTLVDSFYLTGGTALAAYHLGHRYSEDLDFFCEDGFDSQDLGMLLRTLANTLEQGITLDYEQSFNRNLYFVRYTDGEVLKTEFTYYPFPRIDSTLNDGGLMIDSMLDIAVNKLFTVYQRSTARDYIDLYLLCKHAGYTLDDLARKARVKFDWHIDPIQLGTQYLKAQQVADLPRMITPLDDTAWRTFFVDEAHKLSSQVFA